MNNLITTASSQWSSRPSDERFTSLTDMSEHFHSVRNNSRAVVTSTAKLHVRPTNDNKDLVLVGSADVGYEPTNYSFGQLSTLAEAPASYLRTLPAPMAADCLNYGLKYKRDIEDVGLLLTKNDHNELRAATGPRYGRIWNSDVVDAMISRFGDGVTGQWKVPGEFGKPVTVTKKNTTLYGSDRDMFTFLADEENRIEVGGRTLARGFFVWNSEVGAATFGLGTFLYDYVCCNRMICGSRDYTEIKYRHTASAPDRFLMEVAPAIKRYSEGSTSNIVVAIEAARADRLSDVDEWLAKRYGPRQVAAIKAIHELEENRPIETRWDVIVATTARARGIEHTNERVIAEREAGALLGNN